jgi:DNA polymerase III epsilon subunit-like protein
MADKPKILLLDIETAPVMAHVWRIFKTTLGVNQILADWYIMAWAAKWLNEPASRIRYMDQRDARDPENDKKICKELWHMIDEADFIITHNGKRFDIKKLNSRFLFHGIHPPSSFRNIDTLEIFKRWFGETSNKLEFLTEKYNTKYKKLKHNEFPGFDLWKECLRGNLKAWEVMEKYNKHDVLALEELYLKVQPWDTTNFFLHSGVVECKCGSKDFKKNGWHYALTRYYQRYKCKECGYEWRDTKCSASGRYTGAVKI